MLSKLTKKIISLYVTLKFKNIPDEYFHYYRDTYYCRLRQLQFFIRDYIIKKPYKIISYNGEFGNELLFNLPFAYWHHINGTLKGTLSTIFSKEFYFFSENHHELHETRTPEGNYNYEMPRILYSQDYNMKKWKMVPLKEHYKNSVYIYEKPILIIANRYNSEWDGEPVSYFSKERLAVMFGLLKGKFKIIYNRPKSKNIADDNSIVHELNEYEWIKENYPDVLILEDLYNQNTGGVRNYNHLQLMVYANAEQFISIHGGTATLASYFGGTNLIYSKKGPEHYFGCFKTLYPKLSNAKIVLATNEVELESLVIRTFLSDDKRN